MTLLEEAQFVRPLAVISYSNNTGVHEWACQANRTAAGL